ncbi:hypothetical protein [Salmonirosea aquatica]|uniref:Uncharacterized protein n=1 Tax=Salmonirosea aquatica TaxID=2654236 RepID=A0A7C9BGU5_9BACT|nr:hypothetical protein [Cytophagaceae bacterium SJW1-29]
MKRIIFLVLPQLASIANAQTTTQPFHFSVVQSVGTNGADSKNRNYHFSLNLLSGTVNSIKGVEIGALYNQNQGDLTGCQSSGLLNVTKGNVTGYQTAGLTNISGDVKGFQEAGLSNHAQNVNGVQLAGLANTAKEVFGVQLGGLFNKATRLRGYQIGLINISDSIEKGGGIGLVNVYRNGGYREVEVFFADYQHVGLSYKSGVESLYSIVSLGYNSLDTPLFSAGFGIGSLTGLKADWYFKPEIIWYNYLTKDLSFKTATQSTHLRLGIMKRMNKLSLTLYPSVYYANIPKGLEGKLTKTGEFKPFAQNKNGQFGFGLGLGIAFLK